LYKIIFSSFHFEQYIIEKRFFEYGILSQLNLFAKATIGKAHA
jgi:hypothetical protein